MLASDRNTMDKSTTNPIGVSLSAVSTVSPCETFEESAMILSKSDFVL